MPYLILEIHAGSGTYRAPGNVDTNDLTSVYPVVPPSTVHGFLESLAGVVTGPDAPQEKDDFLLALPSSQGTPRYGFKGRRLPGSLSYGWLPNRKGIFGPGGKMRLLTSATVFTGSGKKEEARSRPVFEDRLLDVRYLVVFEGSEEDVQLLRSSVQGKILRKGPLYLGTSTDMVHSLTLHEEIPGSVKWVVKGHQMCLPLSTPRKEPRRAFSQLATTYGRFSYRQSDTVPDNAKITLPAKEST